jgi:hypothetical protein
VPLAGWFVALGPQIPFRINLRDLRGDPDAIGGLHHCPLWTTASTSNCRAISSTAHASPYMRMTELREITRNALIFDSWVMSSSVTPSQNTPVGRPRRGYRTA